MDITFIRSITTLVSFLTFLGIIVWAFRRTNKSAFDEAERLPFLDEELASPVGSHNGSQQ